MRRSVSALALALVASLAPAHAHAQVTAVVDDDGFGTATDCSAATAAAATIGAAIAAAVTGDTILVCPGTYVELVNFAGKGVTLRSIGGPSQTVIDGNALGSVVTFAVNEGRTAVLDGFTIRNGLATISTPGFGDGAGVRIDHASPTVQNNDIVDNRGCGGVGVSVDYGSPLLRGNRILRNSQSGCFGGSGGGVAVEGNGAAEITGNEVAHNTVASGNGGGIALWMAGSPRIERNVIASNSAATGGGISVSSSGNATIVGNLLVGNLATSSGGGIAWSVMAGEVGPRIVNNTIADNRSPQGGALFAQGYDGLVQVTNNIIAATAGQTAVYCEPAFDSMTPMFRSNDVVSPGGARYGGACSDQTGSEGNISADPRFLDPPRGDYHLGAGSAAIDAGRAVGDIVALDIDRDARVADGDGNGAAAVDLGYDELVTRDLVISFGPAFGVWLYAARTGWAALHPFAADALATGDLDGNGTDDVVIDFGSPYGVWAWMNRNAWLALPVPVYADPTSMVTGDIDGDGRDEVIAVTATGLLIVGPQRADTFYPLAVDHVAVANLDGLAGAEVVANVRGVGVHVLRGGVWRLLHPQSVTQMTVADMDGDGRDDLVLDFPGAGLWSYRNDSTWRRLHPFGAEQMVGGDLNGDGRDELVIDFGSAYGLWALVDDAYWVQLHSESPAAMVIGDLDGGGRDDVAIAFGAAGLWLLRDLAAWQPIHSVSPARMGVGRFR